MSNMLTIARRELQAYFVSPIAYVVSAAFLLIMGAVFSIVLVNSREATLRYTFGNGFVLIFILLMAPALTMRLLAEEQRSGTLELLLTAPVRDWEVVLGKFLASLGLWAAMLALTLVYPAIILVLGGDLDRGPAVSVYLGMLLLGSGFLAIGVLTSALTQNQVIAFVVGVGIGLMLWLIEFVPAVIRAPLAEVFSYLGVFQHYFDLTRGVIDTKDVIYLLSLSAAALFLATQVVEARRWR